MPTTSQAAADLLVGCYHRMRRTVDDAMSASGLSLTRTKLLLHVRDAPRRQSVLAELLDQAPRTVTETVDGLERDGLAERLDDPTDRRAKLVTITVAGRAALERSLEVRKHLVDDIFAAFDASSLASFTALLRTLDASPALTPARSAS